ncbi:Hypothetical predicted protein, partial [Paramuricea clavata]
MMFFRFVICVMFFLVYLALSTRLVLCDTLPDIHSDNTSSLLSILEKFKGARNHESRPEGKQEARDYIIETFKKYGLHVWTERAKIGGNLFAENIVGMISSNRTGTADDQIVIVGAHYDTTKITTGIDDNGSGVTALLQVAKNIGKARCEVKNTILFVAFDFEEWTDECNDIACGSNRYVKNITSYLSKSGGTISGAIILETVLNHNSSADSEKLPNGFDKLLPDVYNEVKNDSMRGNFLAVTGRKESDKKLISLIAKHFLKDSNYRTQLIKVPIKGRPSSFPGSEYYNDLYRSDHYSFWEANASYSALMLTDTADFRGYMQRCYHKECDNLSHVKEDDLEFLRRSINAVIKTVLDLSEVDSCKSADVNFG